jgi:NADPH:quinone reductase-like Zn-dependent oxidoreductase
MGSDGAGVVADTGGAVTGFQPGDRVIINPSLHWGDKARAQGPAFEILGDYHQGTFAEYICLPQRYVRLIPSHLSMEEAAATPLAGLTAYRALFSRGELEAGNKVLVTGIGGGAALFVLSYAVAAGAKVYVSSGDQSKIDKAIAYGAKGGVIYKEENWAEQLIAMAGGFDVIVDSAAGKGFTDLTLLANPGGRIVLFGRTAGMIPALNPRTIFWKQLSIHGSTMGTEAEFNQMADFIKQHQLKPVIDSVFAIKDINAAFEKMDKGGQFGKIVLNVEEFM